MLIYNRFIPFKPYAAINFFGVVFVRKGIHLTKQDQNHEYIHTLQQREMLFVFFFLWYIVEWLLRFIMLRNAHDAYRAISFEREAYRHMNNLCYRNHRRHFAWMRYIRKKSR